MSMYTRHPHVTDGILKTCQVTKVAKEIRSVFEKGNQFKSSGQSVAIRTDSNLWITEKSAIENQMPETSIAIKIFRDHISNMLKQKVVSSENHNLLLPRRIMISVYNGNDSFYTLHRDGHSPPTLTEKKDLFLDILKQTKVNGLRAGAQTLAIGQDRMRSELNYRLWTGILYLNVDWHEDDGGKFRYFLDIDDENMTGQSGNSYEVEPVAGRAVLFPSRRLLHGVTPSKKQRLAMTAWIFSDTIVEDADMCELCVGGFNI